MLRHLPGLVLVVLAAECQSPLALAAQRRVLDQPVTAEQVVASPQRVALAVLQLVELLALAALCCLRLVLVRQWRLLLRLASAERPALRLELVVRTLVELQVRLEVSAGRRQFSPVLAVQPTRPVLIPLASVGLQA